MRFEGLMEMIYQEAVGLSVFIMVPLWRYRLVRPLGPLWADPRIMSVAIAVAIAGDLAAGGATAQPWI